jgi:hypothetical protein
LVAQQSKTYSITKEDGTQIVKMKGFSLMQVLLESADQHDIVEELMLNKLPHPYLVGSIRSAPTKVTIFQKRFRIDHTTLLPTNIPDELSTKNLNMIGPRREIDSRWVQWVKTTRQTPKMYQICKPKQSDISQCCDVTTLQPILSQQENVKNDEPITTTTVWTPQIPCILPTYSHGFVFPEGEQPFELLASTLF